MTVNESPFPCYFFRLSLSEGAIGRRFIVGITMWMML